MGSVSKAHRAGTRQRSNSRPTKSTAKSTPGVPVEVRVGMHIELSDSGDHAEVVEVSAFACTARVLSGRRAGEIVAEQWPNVTAVGCVPAPRKALPDEAEPTHTLASYDPSATARDADGQTIRLGSYVQDIGVYGWGTVVSIAGNFIIYLADQGKDVAIGELQPQTADLIRVEPNPKIGRDEDWDADRLAKVVANAPALQPTSEPEGQRVVTDTAADASHADYAGPIPVPLAITRLMADASRLVGDFEAVVGHLEDVKLTDGVEEAQIINALVDMVDHLSGYVRFVARQERHGPMPLVTLPSRQPRKQ